MSLTPQQLTFFARYIEEHTGIAYGDSNIYQLQIRLDNIARTMNLQNSDELWNQVQNGIPEQLGQILLDTATNNETSFFRDRRVFSAIEKLCFPEIRKTRPQALSHRIWCAACSTGQEPYSVAMMASEIREKEKNFRFDILATDFSDRVLTYAKTGAYSQLEVQRGLPTNYLLKFFSKATEATWKINESLKQAIRFNSANLLEAFPPAWGTFDIILCRNVLIYQNPQNKKKVIEKLAERIYPQGYLILGGAESLIGLSDQFNQVSFEGAVIYQKKS